MNRNKEQGDRSPVQKYNSIVNRASKLEANREKIDNGMSCILGLLDKFKHLEEDKKAKLKTKSNDFDDKGINYIQQYHDFKIKKRNAEESLESSPRYHSRSDESLVDDLERSLQKLEEKTSELVDELDTLLKEFIQTGDELNIDLGFYESSEEDEDTPSLGKKY